LLAKFLLQKLWYFIWFVALPLTVAWTVVDILDRMRAVDEFEPWYVLLLFAILFMSVYSLRDHLPFWKDRDNDSPWNRRRRLRNARQLASRMTRLTARHRERISDKARDEIAQAIVQLTAAVDPPDWNRLDPAGEQLESIAGRHLAFARKSPGREYFESIGIAVLIALSLRIFAVEAFKIPSESMVPTLMVGDHIFVSKYQYGLSLPFRNQQLIRFGDPAYGDIIVFAKPSRQEQGFTDDGTPGTLVGTDFIKRVIGLPGDRVEVRRSTVYVNDQPIPRCRVGRTTFKSRDPITDEWVDRTSELWVEQHGDHLYTIVEDFLFDDAEPMVVPPGQVLVFGDNRDRSSDSRMWGTVPIQNIKGRAMIIWWSNERPHGFAWHRVGTRIMGGPELTPAQTAALQKCHMSLP